MKLFLSLFAATFAVAATQSLEEVIRSIEDLTTLVAAIDIVGWIPHDGQITMFLPNNEALSLLDSKFLTSGYIPHLKTILSYHVSPDVMVTLDMITDGASLDMFGGTGGITATVNEMGVFFSGASFSDAQVVVKDLLGTDGVGHIVDQFFLPQQLTWTLLDIAGSIPGFEDILDLVAAAGLEEELTQENRTILAPSNAAFASLPSDFLTQVAANPELRDDLLRYHILIGSIPLEMITDGMQVMTALDVPVVFTVVGGGRFQQISVSDPTNRNAIDVETGDLAAMNGVAHAISGVLEAPTRAPVDGQVGSPANTPTDNQVGAPGSTPIDPPVSAPTSAGAAVQGSAVVIFVIAFSALF